LQKVEQLAKDGTSVILYHPKPESLRKLNIGENVVCEVARTDSRLCEIIDLTLGIEQAVVATTYKYGYGVDFRFKFDAVVVIVDDGSLSSEDVNQMMSRGSRSLGTRECFYYSSDDPLLIEKKKTKLLQENAIVMRDASKILKLTSQIEPKDLG
jgi:hypothetical protein